ncbi:MAG: hypothetical protein ACREJ3_10115, partial [Polyangiaceae bacterium]
MRHRLLILITACSALVLTFAAPPCRAEPWFAAGDNAAEDSFADGDFDAEDVVAMRIRGSIGHADVH